MTHNIHNPLHITDVRIYEIEIRKFGTLFDVLP